MKTVVISGLAAPFLDDPGDAEVWAVNRSYIHQPNLSRLFFMDDLWRLKKFGHREFVSHVNKLNIPIFTKIHYPKIPMSVAYPVQDVLKKFGLLPKVGNFTLSEMIKYGRPYFTSTLAYMMALAMYEGFEKMVLHEFQNAAYGMEYWEQKMCMNFWAGFAAGLGIQLMISENSLLCRPSPWEPPLYGFMEQTMDATIIGTLQSAVLAIGRLPSRMVWCKDIPSEMAYGDGEDILAPSEEKDVA